MPSSSLAVALSMTMASRTLFTLVGQGLGCDVLEAHVAVSDEPTGLVGDVDPPELLASALVEGHRFDEHPPGGERSKEVGRVGEADSQLPPFADRGACPDARRALDRGRVDAAMHDPPRGVVVGTELDVAGDPGPRDLVEDEAGGTN